MSGAPEEAKDPFVGRVIDGRYKIEARLGEGGLGAVYRATQTRLGRPVAVKVLHAEHASTAQLRTRFEREARSLGTLVHPHIVQVIDFGLFEDAPYLVMELLEGKPLNEAIKEGIALPRAFEIGRSIVSAVAYAHGRRVVHRDLKPANVFLQRTPDGREIPRVLDFGLAKFIDSDAEGEGAALTKVGTILGTPSYMSPEQASGAPSDARSDVYSLGIVLFELFAGVRPFRGAPEDLLRAHLFTEMPAIESAGARIPHAEAIDAMLARAAAKRAGDRYQNAGELLAALDALPPLGDAPRAEAAPKAAAPDFTLDRTMAAPAARPPSGKVELATSATAAPASPMALPSSAAAFPPPPNAPAKDPATTSATMSLLLSAVESAREGKGSRRWLLVAAGVGALLLVVGLVAALSGDEAEEATAAPGPSANAAPVAAAEPEPQEADEPAAGRGAPLPPELQAIVGDLRPGGRLSTGDRRDLNAWSRAHPGDPRAWIVTGHADFRNGARTDALRWYENAVEASRSAADDPTLRRDLVIMAGHGRVGRRAQDMVVALFPGDAAAEIDAALREERLDANEQRRLEAFRGSLR